MISNCTCRHLRIEKLNIYLAVSYIFGAKANFEEDI